MELKRTINQEHLNIEFKQDYINIDNTVVISAEGTIFKVGDKVCHEGSEIKGETAIINSFRVDKKSYDIIANTTKGFGRISFMYHPKN